MPRKAEYAKQAKAIARHKPIGVCDCSRPAYRTSKNRPVCDFCYECEKRNQSWLHKEVDDPQLKQKTPLERSIIDPCPVHLDLTYL